MYKSIRPYLFSFEPETVHDGLRALAEIISAFSVDYFIERFYHFEHPLLQTTVAGMQFKSPVGLAAGFDKNAEMLPLMKSLGFGFLEIGSVTAKATKGNPKPRIFRLPDDEAVINRIGLSNIGVEKITKRLGKKKSTLPIGVNIAKTNDSSIIGKNAIEDYFFSYEKAIGVCDYIVLNISCPNTGDGKTFENPDSLDELLSAIQCRSMGRNISKPLFLKISADLPFDKINGLIEVAQKYNVTGYVVSNTTLDRKGLQTDQQTLVNIGNGGLSGAPLRKKSTDLIRYIYKNFGQPIIIGVGGISSAEDAYEKIKAGASLVQIYTSLIYQGPSVVRTMNMGLVSLLEQAGYKSVQEAVGSETE